MPGSAGGDYDLRARLVARHLGRMLPGQPNVVVRNMPGGIGIQAGNYMGRWFDESFKKDETDDHRRAEQSGQNEQQRERNAHVVTQAGAGEIGTDSEEAGVTKGGEAGVTEQQVPGQREHRLDQGQSGQKQQPGVGPPRQARGHTQNDDAQQGGQHFGVWARIRIRFLVRVHFVPTGGKMPFGHHTRNTASAT